MIHPWATHLVHDGPIEHWRVTALLAKDALRLKEVVASAFSSREIPEDVQRAMNVLENRLELTDYFLSGLLEEEKKHQPRSK